MLVYILEKNMLTIFCACRGLYHAVEVTAHTFLPSSYMNKKVPYKYVIQYPNESYDYEYIHDLSVRDTCNRVLELGSQTIISKGIHKAYIRWLLKV